MIARLSAGGRRPWAFAAFHATASHAHESFFAESVSPMVFAVCGGTGYFAGSATSRLAPAAGAMPLGWYGGFGVFGTEAAGVDHPLKQVTGPRNTRPGEARSLIRSEQAATYACAAPRA